MRPIDSDEIVELGLDALCRIDPRLVTVREFAGPVPLRRSEPGFASLVSIIISQQVSKASAAAITARLTTLARPLSARTIREADDELFRSAGLSRPKQKTLRALASAVDENRVDLDVLCRIDRDQAISKLTAIHGIGLWTAQVYLMFAAGHPDIFPSRDVALQTAVGQVFGHESRPGEKVLDEIAKSWAPWRSVAARLFWAYYAAARGCDAVPA